MADPDTTAADASTFTRVDDDVLQRGAEHSWGAVTGRALAEAGELALDEESAAIVDPDVRLTRLASEMDDELRTMRVWRIGLEGRVDSARRAVARVRRQIVELVSG